MDSQDIDESARKRFEADWRDRRAQPIEAYLPAADDPRYVATLEELIHIELEFSWKSGPADGPLVEKYLVRFPPLNERAIVLRLVQEEYAARDRFAQRPGLEEYRARFRGWNFLDVDITGDLDLTNDSSLSTNDVRPVSSSGDLPTQPVVGRGPPVMETVPPSSETRSRRYTLSRLHAEGGLGRVWVARDGDLNRDVALKELQPQHGDRDEVCWRFLKEAQITGQLEHPNIVPVYELGRRPDNDQPFYTMRFVRGQTFRAAVSQFHKARLTGQANPLDSQRLLQAFVAVCHAVSYAHARGVIHRDLKPENVVLGSFGEVLVLDWGLAKLQDEPESAPQVEVTGMAHVRATQSGHVLGTPAYMAPEQADGRIAAIDTRTDIYGLGAILFEILTGHPPHSGEDSDALLDQIIVGPTPRARQADATVPPALDAVCAKAMALHRDDRYQQATQLTEDVQRFLADEPVSVYREPWTATAGRWLRRHKTGATASAAALVLITIVSLVALVLVRQQQAIAEAARQREAEQRRRAEGELKLAQDAVDRILLHVSTERLATLPKNEPVRREMLAIALGFCQGLLDQNPTDPGVRWRTGRAQRQVAKIYQYLGQFDDSERHYQAAIRLLEPLVTESPGEPDYVRDLAGAYNSWGNLLEMKGRKVEAEKYYREAIERFEKISKDHPQDADYRLNNAVGYNNLGILLLSNGEAAEAQAAHERAMKTYQALVEEFPKVVEYRQSLATSHNNLGAVYRATARLPEAQREFGTALAMFRALEAADPDQPDYRLAAAKTASNLAATLEADNQHDEAGKAYGSAVATFEKLVKDFPTMSEYRFDLAACLTNQAWFLDHTGQPAAAEQAFRRSLALYDQAHDTGPAPLATDLAATLYGLGVLALETGKLDDAEPPLERALGLQQLLVDQNPANARLQTRLAMTLQSAGELMVRRGNFKAARNFYVAAVRAQQTALDKAPQNETSRILLADQYAALAEAQLKLGDLASAAASAGKIPEIFPTSGAQARRAAELLSRCFMLAESVKAVDFDPQQCAAQAIKLLESAAAAGSLDKQALGADAFNGLRDQPAFQKLEKSLK